MRFLTLLLAFTTLAASAAEQKLSCLEKDKAKIRYRAYGEQKVETKPYCFGENGHLESAACTKQESCEARKALNQKDTRAAPAASEFGTPGFHACRSAGGSPQIIEYFDGKDWKHGDRCIFKDNSFVSTAALMPGAK